MDVQSRRAFLRAALAAGAAWAATDLAPVEAALTAAARQTAAGGDAFTALSPSQAAVVAAMAARIIPSVDGRPGAREAGAIHFIDKALATFNQKQRSVYADGVKDLERRAATLGSPVVRFADLPVAAQDDVLRQIEHTPFFQMVRFDTIVGTFGSPVWGGNRDHAGWQMLGFTHQPAFQPPFGYYDTGAAGTA
jgi:gluconate 2-dehydrogenase gamma chain